MHNNIMFWNQLKILYLINNKSYYTLYQCIKYSNLYIIDYKYSI